MTAVVLGSLANFDDSIKQKLVEGGAIAPLVSLAAGGNDEQKEWASQALGCLVNCDVNYISRKIVEGGGIAPLVALAAGGNDEQKEQA